jgi:photosystem II stability/assembly factor-like uncharacterized protein
VALGEEIRMTDKIDIEAALRASLTEHARHAPAASMLAEHIIGEVDLLPPARERRWSRQWRTWTLPLVAAGSVAAVAAALIGVTQFRHSADHKPPAVPVTSIAPAPTPSATAPAPRSTAPNPPPATHSAPKEVTLTHFQAIDLTFVGADRAWALGTADCLNGRAGPCAAMVRTTDGGASWHGMTPPPANVTGANGCADPCVHHIRFATDGIGYAYGPSALFMTTDGGANWQRQPGGADGLETLDGNVIRVVDQAGGGCVPGCDYNVETAAIGGTKWRSVDLPGTYDNGSSVGVALVRTGHRAFVEVFGHVAGGGQDATSLLYTSADDGATWTRRGEPCPQSAGREVDSMQVSAGADGSVAVLCSPRGGGGGFTAISADGTGPFRAGGPLPANSAGGLLGAASARVQLVVSADALYRTQDGGNTWQPISAVPLGASPTFIGFESATVGRVVIGTGQTIWTTRDAGLTWTKHTFS